MGIYDRDYVRREGPSFLGSFVERGRVCRWLVGINVVAFIIQILTSPHGLDQSDNLGWFTEAFQLDVAHLLHGQVWRLLTYAFLHDPYSIWHILFNMLFLWWFGSDVEDLYGPREFLIYYLTSAVAAGVLYFVSSLAWMPSAVPCVGASGAVIAVLTLCAIHYPRRVILLMFILPVPIWIFLVVFLAGDAYVFLRKVDSATAVAAHLGGALFAFVYYRLHWRLSDWRLPSLRGWRRRLFGPRLRVHRDEEARSHWSSKQRPSSPASLSIRRPEEGTQASVGAPAASRLDDEHLEAKMDAILEKLSRVGKENLTEGEKELLVRASEAIRRRRR